MAMAARCPSCQAPALRLENFDALMVLSETRAVFTIRCTQCNHVVSVIETIPPTLYEQVQQAAQKANAGMGRSLT